MKKNFKKIVSDPEKTLMKRAIRQQRMQCKEIVEGCFIAISRNCKKNRNRKKLDKMKNRIKTLARKLLPQIKKDEKNKLKK